MHAGGVRLVEEAPSAFLANVKKHSDIAYRFSGRIDSGKENLAAGCTVHLSAYEQKRSLTQPIIA
jgi:hypothetical protein